MSRKQNQKLKGSILAYSLIILFLMLSIVTAMSMATITEKKSSSVTEDSVQAYQTADSGVQMAVKRINAAMTLANNTLNDAFPSECNNGQVSNSDLGQGTYTLTFYDKNGTLVNACTTQVTALSSLKAVGIYKNIVRAVKVALSDSFTKLLLHGEGTIGNQSFIDSESVPKNVNANGSDITIAVPASGAKFGSGSILLAKDTSYLTFTGTGAPNDFDISSGKWTMDCWVYPTGDAVSPNDYMTIFRDGGPGANSWAWKFGLTHLVYIDPGITWDVSLSAPNTLTANSWNHVAIASDGTSAYMFVNGNLIQTHSAFNPPFHSTPALAQQSNTGQVNGSNQFYIDEFRFSKGIARWSANFTPPTSPY